MLPVYTIINKTNLAAIAALSMLVFSGCGKDEPQYVEVQEVKESPAAQEQNMLSEMNQEAHAHAHDFFHYEKPSNWTEIGHSSMILMAFQAGNPPELVAEMQVSAFPGDVGGKLANINRWRRQVGLGPVAPEAVNDFMTELEISDLPAWQVSFTGPAGSSDSGQPNSMIVSAVMFDEKTWFFKLQGPESAVKGESENYRAFIASVKF